MPARASADSLLAHVRLTIARYSTAQGQELANIRIDFVHKEFGYPVGGTPFVEKSMNTLEERTNAINEIIELLRAEREKIGDLHYELDNWMDSHFPDSRA